MSALQTGSLMRFWLWAAIGAVAMLGSLFSVGAFLWPLVGAGIGLLAARSITRRAALMAVAVGVAGPAVAAALSSPWPLVAAIPAALALGLVRDRREAAVLTGGLVLALAVLLALRYGATPLAVVLAPALLVLAALAAGRPQREAAGAITGAGLALFAVGGMAPGVSLTVAGAVLMLALGLRRRRLAAVRA